MGTQGHRIIVFDDYRVDVDRGTVSRADEELYLRPKSFAVLMHLIEHQGVLVSKDELMEAIWSDTVVTDGALTQCIIDIRRVLEDEDHQIIRTVPRRGFIFEAQARADEADARAPAADSGHGIVVRASVWALAAVAVAVVVITLTWWVDPASTGSTPAPTVLAVLPFSDNRPQAERTYLARSLSAEILNKLAQVPHLQVVSRIASFGEDPGDDIRSIGKTLDATHVIVGSVSGDDARLRVNAQLVEVASGYELWAGDFDLRGSDLIDTQEQIARSIAGKLRTELVPAEIATAVDVSTDDPVAYDLYLQASEMLRHARDSGIVGEALERLDQALTREPLFVEAEAAKCTAHRRLLDLDEHPGQLDLALQSCRRAIDLSPNHLTARLELGNLLQMTGQMELAESQLRDAVADFPQHALAHLELAEVLAERDRTTQADRHFDIAAALEPGNAEILSEYAFFLGRQNRFDEAIPRFERAISLVPHDSKYRIDFGVALFYRGRFDEAAAVFEAAIPHDGDAGLALNNAGASHYLAGQFARAHGLFLEASAANPGGYFIWGNLGDSCRHAPDCSDEQARLYYQKAVELAGQQLSIRPNDAELHASIGVYGIRLGDTDSGRAAIQRALTGEITEEVALDIALGYEALDLIGEASQWAQHAIELGYPRTFLEADPDLGSLPLFDR
ncbi:MAG: tetratricopeptide repeat protein [Pseudomonadota bacterium]|nr:MAG: tetratricopeptide repeat protein [Pseudomonadota bacterium]